MGDSGENESPGLSLVSGVTIDTVIICVQF